MPPALQSPCSRNCHYATGSRPHPTATLRASPAELLRALQGGRGGGYYPVQRCFRPRAYVLLRSPSPRSRSSAVRMELPAAALRCAARLLRRDVYPHSAGPRGAAPERTVSLLREKIDEEVRERGPIPFSRYMELCLYDPELGYYSRNAKQFGKAGDFYTSSDVHAVFGRLLARQFDEMWRVLGSPEHIVLLEFGPGRGLFAQDVLDWSEKKFPDFFRALHYVLVESSPALRQRIETTLTRHLEAGKTQISSSTYFDCTPESSLSSAAERRKNAAHGASRGSDIEDNQAPEGRKKLPQPEALPPQTPTVLFANEFFDALPVEILSPQGSLRIDARESRFIETWAQPNAQELDRKSTRLNSSHQIISYAVFCLKKKKQLLHKHTLTHAQYRT